MKSAADPALAALEALIDRLHMRGRLRVWSLVITMFGDAIVPRGGRVGLAALQEIMERLRIESGALRTAMSRLAKEGWVIRERRGRNSFFRLDERGGHAFDLATRRIYAAGPPEWSGGWTVAIAPPGVPEADAAELAALGFVRVSGAVHLRPDTAEAGDPSSALKDMLVIHGTGAEHPEEVASAYRDFIASHRTLGAALAAGGRLFPRDAMAARTLVVHDWRRIALRDPGLPRELLPLDWPGDDARRLAGGIFRLLEGASEAWLDAAGLPPQADPERFARRWGQAAGQSSR